MYYGHDAALELQLAMASLPVCLQAGFSGRPNRASVYSPKPSCKHSCYHHTPSLGLWTRSRDLSREERPKICILRPPPPPPPPFPPSRISLHFFPSHQVWKLNDDIFLQRKRKPRFIAEMYYHHQQRTVRNDFWLPEPSSMTRVMSPWLHTPIIMRGDKNGGKKKKKNTLHLNRKPSTFKLLRQWRQHWRNSSSSSIQWQNDELWPVALNDIQNDKLWTSDRDREGKGAMSTISCLTQPGSDRLEIRHPQGLVLKDNP